MMWSQIHDVDWFFLFSLLAFHSTWFALVRSLVYGWERRGDVNNSIIINPDHNPASLSRDEKAMRVYVVRFCSISRKMYVEYVSHSFLLTSKLNARNSCCLTPEKIPEKNQRSSFSWWRCCHCTFPGRIITWVENAYVVEKHTFILLWKGGYEEGRALIGGFEYWRIRGKGSLNYLLRGDANQIPFALLRNRSH